MALPRADMILDAVNISMSTIEPGPRGRLGSTPAATHCPHCEQEIDMERLIIETFTKITQQPDLSSGRQRPTLGGNTGRSKSESRLYTLRKGHRTGAITRPGLDGRRYSEPILTIPRFFSPISHHQKARQSRATSLLAKPPLEVRPPPLVAGRSSFFLTSSEFCDLDDEPLVVPANFFSIEPEPSIPVASVIPIYPSPSFEDGLLPEMVAPPALKQENRAPPPPRLDLDRELSDYDGPERSPLLPSPATPRRRTTVIPSYSSAPSTLFISKSGGKTRSKSVQITSPTREDRFNSDSGMGMNSVAGPRFAKSATTNNLMIPSSSYSNQGTFVHHRERRGKGEEERFYLVRDPKYNQSLAMASGQQSYAGATTASKTDALQDFDGRGVEVTFVEVPIKPKSRKKRRQHRHGRIATGNTFLESQPRITLGNDDNDLTEDMILPDEGTKYNRDDRDEKREEGENEDCSTCSSSDDDDDDAELQLRLQSTHDQADDEDENLEDDDDDADESGTDTSTLDDEDEEEDDEKTTTTVARAILGVHHPDLPINATGIKLGVGENSSSDSLGFEGFGLPLNGMD